MILPSKEKRVRVSAYWADDWKSIVLDPEDWESILSGEKFADFGEGYSYEGKEFEDYWNFAGGLGGEVRVTYSDGGEGFTGKLKEATIEEVDDNEPT